MAVNCPECGTIVPEAVPAAEIATVKEQLAAAEARVAELEAAAAANAEAAAKVAELEGQVAELEAEVASEKLEKAMVMAGVTDPEGMEICRLCWERLPEEDRPEFGEWLADHEHLPRAVLAYMPTGGEATAEAPAVATQETTVVRTSTTVAAGGSAPGAVEFTPEMIDAMTDEEFAKYEAAILAQIARG